MGIDTIADLAAMDVLAKVMEARFTDLQLGVSSPPLSFLWEAGYPVHAVYCLFSYHPIVWQTITIWLQSYFRLATCGMDF